MTDKKAVVSSWDDFDLTKQSESAFEFEYLADGNIKTGVLISVIGKDSPKFDAWVTKALEKRRAEELYYRETHKGKEMVRPIQDEIDFLNESAARRIVSWQGLPEEYSHERALWLMSKNSEMRDQVLDQSNKVANFIKKPLVN